MMNLVCEQELKQISDIIEVESDENCVNFGGLRWSTDNRSRIASSSGDITEQGNAQGYICCLLAGEAVGKQ